MIAAWVTFWVLSWAGISLLSDKFPKSSRDDENTPQWVAQTCLALVRSVFVAVGASFAPDDAFLDQCGYSFFSFEIVDLVIGLIYGLHTTDMLLHHGLHIAAGALIWAAGLHALARPLMMQEMSSIFLNLFVMARNRVPSISTALFVCFGLSFMVFRMGNGSLAAYRFFQSGTHPTVGYLVLGGAALQWWWGYSIALKVQRQLKRGADDPSKDA